MLDNKLVSVIVPAYNHEKYVQKTIKSIINQTYKNIELIVIDDGSKDSTWQKIQEMEPECRDRFVNVHFETKQNEGTCKTLNKLLSFANGEYIYLIASDDMAVPQAIEKEAAFLDKNPEYALCVGNNKFIDSNDETCVWKEKNYSFDNFAAYLKYTRRDVNFGSSRFGEYDTLYIGNYIPNGYLIRKSIFEKTGLFTPEAPLEDHYLMLQISKYAKMKYIDEILFLYRQHDTNTVKNKEKMQKLIHETLAYENKLLDKIDDNFSNKIVVDVKNRGALAKQKRFLFFFKIYKYLKYDIAECKYKGFKVIKFLDF